MRFTSKAMIFSIFCYQSTRVRSSHKLFCILYHSNSLQIVPLSETAMHLYSDCTGPQLVCPAEPDYSAWAIITGDVEIYFMCHFQMASFKQKGGISRHHLWHRVTCRHLGVWRTLIWPLPSWWRDHSGVPELIENVGSN